jgi:hypothetical protein
MAGHRGHLDDDRFEDEPQREQPAPRGNETAPENRPRDKDDRDTGDNAENGAPATPEPPAPSGPRRGGWWQRRGFGS